jgi:hypothetical protein
MAARQSESGKKDKSFADFVAESPSVQERSVMLSGAVLRSEKEGMFVLATPDGQMLELNIDDVQDYEVMAETGQRMVQLRILANRLPSDVTARTLPTVDQPQTLKELITDNVIDQTLKEGPWDTFKEVGKDPLETIKEMGKDPIYDTGKEPITDPITWVENIGTAVENVGQGLPGGGVVNPAVAGGAAPFVMATPHHAATAPMMMQAMAQGQRLLKQPHLDGSTMTRVPTGELTIKEVPKDGNLDTVKEMATDQITDQTLKEGPWDTIKEVGKDPTFDTFKELIGDPNTWVENIGTAVENVGQGLPGGGVVNPAIWNLPGLMF